MNNLIIKIVLIFNLLITNILAEKFVNAVWYNVYTIDLSDEQKAKEIIDQQFEKLNDMHINTVFFLTKYTDGKVYYNSKIAPRASKWDVLEYIVKKSRHYNMEIHPYINVFIEEGNLLKENPLWAEKRQDGTVLTWSSPAVDAVRNRILAIVKEIIKNYDVDGIQLDRIRYQGFFDTGYNKYSLKKYKLKYNKEADTKDKDFQQFKNDLISSFVKETYKIIKKQNPRLKFSCAVYHTPTTAKNNNIFQEWDLWVKNGWVDYIYPMSYTNDIIKFKGYLQENVDVIKKSKTKVKLVMGLGAYYNEMTDEKLKQQIELCFNEPLVSGICYFNANSIINYQFYELLKNVDFENKKVEK